MSRSLRLLFLAAGLADAATGVALLAAPRLTLTAMAVSPLPAEPIYMRWLGAFVLGVGTAYLLAFLPLAGAAARRRTVIEVTAVQRGAVALFVATAAAGGALPGGWWTVAAFDGILALVQVAVLRRGSPRDGTTADPACGARA